MKTKEELKEKKQIAEGKGMMKLSSKLIAAVSTYDRLGI
jgi:hypothetical protein